MTRLHDVNFFIKLAGAFAVMLLAWALVLTPLFELQHAATLADHLAVGLATLIFTPLSLAHIPALLYFAIAGTLMHGLIGTLVGIWAQKWDQYAVIHTFVLLPLSFLSGVFYRVETLPDIARQLISLNPIFYVIDGFRWGVTGTGASSPVSAGGIVLIVDLILFLSVYLCFRRGYRLKP